MVQAEAAPTNIYPDMLNAMEWRCIGPPRGGRVVAVAGDPLNPAVFYFGACAGGVWKTYDGGTYWENVSDGHFETSSVGAIAVADSDPNVVYVGMGESCIRLDVSYGDGVYRSTDAGESWIHLGLSDTRHISRVRIHPQNPDIVYVAALGHAFGPNDQRGVFRTEDGGKTWEHVLNVSQEAGAADLSMDPNNPRILYAAIWQVRRSFWELSSGGSDSGLYRSRDGGDTWTRISDNDGFPKGIKGRIGVAVSSKAGRVWATVEADECGLYRSDNYGATWGLASDDQDLQGRPWYYQHVFADPQDAETIWILNTKAWKSTDAGKTFTRVTTPHGDNHDLWIDTRNPQRMIEGNDGGACVSFNGGDSWSTTYNQLTSQFYHLATDNQFPYRVYATQQDNSAISVPSRSHKGAIRWGDCYTVGASESGYIALHPDDPNIIVSGAIGSSPGGGGNLLRYDHRTGQSRIITVWPEQYYGHGAKDMKYRFQWTFPIQFSPHDPGVLYVAANLLFRSTNQGSSWESISPDLTRNDVSKMEPSGGPITKDTTGAETYGTIYAFVESPHKKGVFWAGSDDGLVHISHNGGSTWANITPPGLPEWSLISMIEVSTHDAGKAYLAATRYKLDDNQPILYKTRDYGATWDNISKGIPEHDFTRAIREDPCLPGMLYVGTETGIYVSFNDGHSWHSLQANLPKVPIYDLAVKDDDLIAATHGRSFWILDDVTQLRQVAMMTTEVGFKLLKPRDTYRVQSALGDRKPVSGKHYQLSVSEEATYRDSLGCHGERIREVLNGGQNPPDGVIVTYYLSGSNEEAVLSFIDEGGHTITSFSSLEPTHTESSDQVTQQRVPAEVGMNRFVWDMRYPDARRVPGDKTTEDLAVGPLAPPGSYKVRLSVGGISQVQSFQILKDPRVDALQEHFNAQFKLLIKIRDKLSETHDSINTARSIKQQVDEWTNRAKSSASVATIRAAAANVKQRLTEIENELVQVNFRGARDVAHLPRKLNSKLAELVEVVASADFAPTRQAYDVFEDISARIDVQLEAFQKIIDTDLPEFENLIHELEIPMIVPRTAP